MVKLSVQRILLYVENFRGEDEVCVAKRQLLNFALLLNFASLSPICWFQSSHKPSAESLARRQNAVVSTYSNDIVLLSLNFKYHLLDLTSPNDIVRVASASLPPAGSPIATHYPQSPRCWFQNTAFNETTSLHFFDCFPKPETDLLIRSTTGNRTPSSVCTRRADEFDTNGISTTSTCVTLNGSGIQLAVGSQPLRLRNHNFGLIHRIMVKRLATSSHDPLGITDNACKNQSVMVSVQYGPFNTYIPIRSTIIGTSRVARDLITMHTSRRSNSDIACVTRVSMTFRVVRTNQYNQDLRLIHSTNGNHLESPNEGSSIDHQVTIHMHAQNITMFPTNETWYFTSQMLVSSVGDPDPPPARQRKNRKHKPGDDQYENNNTNIVIHRVFKTTTLLALVRGSNRSYNNVGSSRTCVTLNGSGIQLAVGPQPLWLRNHNSGLAQRIMVKRLATSPHDPLGIIDSACKNQLVVVSVQYGPFNPYIPIRSTTIGKSRVAIDLIAMHTSWRSNSDIASVTSSTRQMVTTWKVRRRVVR
ncbi:hypothetical protein F511_23314 [Dorcoceras hygrometricum]|uniref:Uncharacterized protein n=1 Tax=Dorcoceras hygrometricum TaxID=472368 RepID=A0A2Z7D012_9LAMI|nr:hypothetical protein F511_23314 [Dorcoceras hygrometricum]